MAYCARHRCILGASGGRAKADVPNIGHDELLALLLPKDAGVQRCDAHRLSRGRLRLLRKRMAVVTGT